MTTKRNTEEALLQGLLNEMKEGSLPIVTGGGFEIEVAPTGIASFDRSTGVGGFPRQRMSLVQGEEASGKTMLLLIAIAYAQAAGGRCAFVDLEHALTPSFARLFGVDYDALVISRPRTLNQAYDVARKLGTSGLFDIVGFDSAVSLATVADLERSAEDSTERAGQAQVHSDELKKMVSSLHQRTAFIMINQLREDPNPPKWWKGGKKLYSPGGRALRHYSSLSIEVKKKKPYKQGDLQVGHQVETYIFKNKVAQPFRRSLFDLFYASGVDMDQDLVASAIALGVVTKSGSWLAPCASRCVSNSSREAKGPYGR
jgi:recombination protein RecA